MEEYDGRHEDGTLLTQEEETSLRLLEPLFTRHRDRILETLAPHLGNDHDRASLLSDDLAVARLKRSQQEYLFSLPNGNNGEIAGRNAAQAADYRGPFGLGAGWHLRTFVHFLTSVQPLVFDAFGNRPHLYHTVWNALLKVIFHDLELAMSESLAQRDDLLEAAGRDMSEMKRALNLALGKQAVEERQRQAEQRTVVSLLTTWLSKTSGLAQEMGTPLNVILGQAESAPGADRGRKITSCPPEHCQAGRTTDSAETAVVCPRSRAQESLPPAGFRGNGGRASTRMLKSRSAQRNFDGCRGLD